MHSDLEERSKLAFLSVKPMMMLNGVFLWSKPKRTDVIKEIVYFIVDCIVAVNSNMERRRTGSCEKQLFYIYRWLRSLQNSGLILFSSWTHFIRNSWPEICLLNGFIIVNQRVVWGWTRESLMWASGIQVDFMSFIIQRRKYIYGLFKEESC